MTPPSSRSATWLAFATALLAGCTSKAPPRPLAAVGPAVSGSPSAASAIPVASSAAPSAALLAPAVAAPQSAPTVEVGSAHPAVLSAVPPDGHWLVLCQARKDTDGDGKIDIGVGHHGDLFGDEMSLFFVRGGGLGSPIAAYAGADRSGRHVVIARGKTLVLLDTFSDRETELSGGVIDDGSTAFAGRGSVSFDDAGRRLLYFRASDKGDVPVVRELATGAEQVVDVGPGLLWSAYLDAGGELVVARMVVADTDGNGKVELPTMQTSLSKRACRGPVTSYSTGGLRGDRAEPRIVRAADGWKVTGPALPGELLGAFGRAVVVRRADGALIRKDGKDETILLPAACAARVLHADPAKERLFFGCTGGAKKDSSGYLRSRLERLDGPARTALGLGVQLPDRDAWTHDRELLYLDDNKALQLQTGTVGVINVGPPQAVAGDRILFAKHSIGSPGGANILDLGTGKRTKLAVDVNPAGRTARRGNLIALQLESGKSALFDVATAEVKGHFEGTPLSLSTGGKVLVSVPAAQGKLRADRLLEGPFRWVSVP